MCYVPNYLRTRDKPVRTPKNLRCFNVYPLEFALTGHHDRTYYGSGCPLHLVKRCLYFLFPAFGGSRCFPTLYVPSIVCLTNTIAVLVTRLFVSFASPKQMTTMRHGTFADSLDQVWRINLCQ